MSSGPVLVGGIHAAKAGPALKQCTGQTRAAREEKHRKAVPGSWTLPAPAALGPLQQHITWVAAFGVHIPMPSCELHNIESNFCASLSSSNHGGTSRAAGSFHTGKLSAEVRGHLPGSGLQKTQVQINQTSDTYGRLVWGVSFGHTIRFYLL